MRTSYAPLIALETIVSRYHLRLLVMFGSHGTSAQKDDSDIDLAYLSEGELSRPEQEALLHDLILHYRKAEIDLLDLRCAEPVIRAMIAQEGRVVYEAESGLFKTLALYYIKQKMDLAPFIQRRMAEIRKNVLEEIRAAREGNHLRKD